MESRDTFSFFKRETNLVPRNTKVSRKYFKHLRAFSKKQKPDKYSGHLNLVIDSEPSTFEMWEDSVIEKNDV